MYQRYLPNRTVRETTLVIGQTVNCPFFLLPLCPVQSCHGLYLNFIPGAPTAPVKNVSFMFLTLFSVSRALTLDIRFTISDLIKCSAI